MKKIRLLITSIAVGLSLAGETANAADVDLLQLKQTISLSGVEGRIDHLAIDAALGRLYVAAIGNNTVEVVDLAAGRRIDTLKGFQEPQGVAVVPSSHRVAIGSGGDGKCRIYDQSLKLVAQIDDLEDADNVRFNAKTGQAIVGYGRGALAFIDPQAGTKVAETKLGGHPESFQLSENGDRIFVNVPGAGHVAVVDGDKRVVTAKWPMEKWRGNFPMALDEEHQRLFVGCRNPARLVVFDTEKGISVSDLEISGDTDDVFYDAKRQRLYVSCGEGFLDVIQCRNEDRFERIARIGTRDGARTCFFSPELDLLFLAAPKRVGREAEIRIYQPQ